MRLADIIPGVLVAVPGSVATNHGGFIHGNDASVRAGKIACPARVIAVGKFRMQRQGNCEAGVVEDNYQTTVHIQIPDFKTIYTNRSTGETEPPQRSWGTHSVADDKWPGYPRGPKVPSKPGKSFPMIDVIANPRSIIMPWDHFLKLREERIFQQAEVSAYQERQREINKELTALLRMEAEELPKEFTDARSTVIREGKRIQSPDDPNEATHIRFVFEVAMPVEIAKLTPGVKELMAEYEDLQRRLTCSR